MLGEVVAACCRREVNSAPGAPSCVDRAERWRATVPRPFPRIPRRCGVCAPARAASELTAPLGAVQLEHTAPSPPGPRDTGAVTPLPPPSTNLRGRLPAVKPRPARRGPRRGRARPPPVGPLPQVSRAPLAHRPPSAAPRGGFYGERLPGMARRRRSGCGRSGGRSWARHRAGGVVEIYWGCTGDVLGAGVLGMYWGVSEPGRRGGDLLGMYWGAASGGAGGPTCGPGTCPAAPFHPYGTARISGPAVYFGGAGHSTWLWRL